MKKTIDRSIAQEPEKWYKMMRGQVQDYEDSLLSDWFKGLDSSEKANHWYAGALLASDLLRAADAALNAKPQPGILTRVWRMLF